jgi:4-hydroxy-tetrahydrodipicolinate synthase
MVYFNRLCVMQKQRPDWTVLVGPEELLAQSMLLGGRGGVSGGANVFPKFYVALYNAMCQGQTDRARALQEQILQVSQRLYCVGKHPSAVVKGIKCAASCLGICNDFMAEPFHRCRTPERQLIDQAVAELKQLYQKLP